MPSISDLATPLASTIPVVDFSKWRNAKHHDEQLAVARELVDACRSIGFVSIVNHGLPDELLDEAFATSARLYNLSYDEKMLAAHPPGTAVHRGYTAPGRMKETIDYAGDTEAENQKRAKGDCKETFEIGSEQNPSQPNVWVPESVLPGFEQFMMRFYWQCNKISQEILRAIAMGINLRNTEHLTKLHGGHHNQLRLSHYPAIPAAELENNEVDRLGPHTDFSTVTLVFQDHCGGLQVRSPSKNGETFVEATPIRGACVMNIGDPLMRWSNDVLLSNIHRVGIPPIADRVKGERRMTGERYSIPYFVVADPEAMVEPFPECIDAEHPVKYEPISTIDYQKMRFAEYYDKAA